MYDFDCWNDLKKSLDASERIPLFKERDVWWCSIGKNVGHEQNGKNEMFNRPVLVVKKFSPRLFWGVPLSTQIKESRHYHKFYFNECQQSALLTQMRLLDASRLTDRLGRLAEREFQNIRKDLAGYLK